jgi:hypothetical protein
MRECMRGDYVKREYERRVHERECMECRDEKSGRGVGRMCIMRLHVLTHTINALCVRVRVVECGSAYYGVVEGGRELWEGAVGGSCGRELWEGAAGGSCGRGYCWCS